MVQGDLSLMGRTMGNQIVWGQMTSASYFGIIVSHVPLIHALLLCVFVSSSSSG
jgi:hypothetical protein